MSRLPHSGHRSTAFDSSVVPQRLHSTRDASDSGSEDQRTRVSRRSMGVRHPGQQQRHSRGSPPSSGGAHSFRTQRAHASRGSWHHTGDSHQAGNSAKTYQGVCNRESRAVDSGGSVRGGRACDSRAERPTLRFRTTQIHIGRASPRDGVLPAIESRSPHPKPDGP